ncbi:TPA: hypothetical protein JDH36_004425 [Salmonella enterica subsp. indica]|uniref:T6SS immunity protein Tli4 family protein n=2 Tax=Enterobacter hormaechei TaxID=158836 RepID=UPI0017905E84|nr:hypothetical protein [Enterobacter hormaechei]MCE1963967.1 hypothetical protein [Enterobacter hormaechei]HAE8197594.1 hypothetical protein [Salmonella enterica subsp. indica serovar 41:b:1,7]HAU3220702.1 hypothetical protein [Salmonella enterica subsp. indica]HAV1763094.1 hypothetical protein [Enterobacter hormaechei subsp. steigerwaltii]
MKKIFLLSLFLLCSYTSYADNTTWEKECIGYYKLDLPDNLELGRYPAERIYVEDIAGMKAIFGEYHRLRSQGRNIENPFSGFYYENYRVMISDNNFVDLESYKNKAIELLSEYNNTYYVKDYSADVFFLSYKDSHSLYIRKNHRLYQFMKGGGRIDPLLGMNRNNLNFNKESDVISLLGRFQSRGFYDIPSGQGFCLPYGFIANDSGSEDRSMAVTYRMKNHPDVMILFQDASYQLPNIVPRDSDLNPIKNYDAKDYAKWLWNHIYMLYPEQKRKLLSPGWFSVTMDGRKGSGSFLEVTRKDGNKDYGYLAFVRADPKNSTKEPDLQVFVTSRSDLAEGHPQISPDELKALAEHIVSSVEHR